jgi:phosphoglycerol transferase MdoB-like AlkP superfamily enzyme
MGFFFDLGTCSFIVLPALVYIAVMPNRFIGNEVDKSLIYIFFVPTVFILMFTFLAELTFWEEFRTRFNFIAVDYLIYTHEVIGNIKESYPLPLLIGIVLLATAAVFFIFTKRAVFKNTFSEGISLRQRAAVLLGGLSVMFFFIGFIRNTDAEWSANRYNNEISKAGIYSFFAEFRNNRMDYADFYTTVNNKDAFAMARQNVKENNTSFDDSNLSIKRAVNGQGTAVRPNVVFILMESMSASFMEEFGNDKHITPYMDSLAQKSILFSNLYATGTRTVRGMEAVTLCIPAYTGAKHCKKA